MPQRNRIRAAQSALHCSPVESLQPAADAVKPRLPRIPAVHARAKGISVHISRSAEQN
jgi:hypothetical protein